MILLAITMFRLGNTPLFVQKSLTLIFSAEDQSTTPFCNSPKVHQITTRQRLGISILQEILQLSWSHSTKFWFSNFFFFFQGGKIKTFPSETKQSSWPHQSWTIQEAPSLGIDPGLSMQSIDPGLSTLSEHLGHPWHCSPSWRRWRDMSSTELSPPASQLLRGISILLHSPCYILQLFRNFLFFFLLTFLCFLEGAGDADGGWVYPDAHTGFSRHSLGFCSCRRKGNWTQIFCYCHKLPQFSHFQCF